jgi:hypothetical protein
MPVGCKTMPWFAIAALSPFAIVTTAAALVFTIKRDVLRKLPAVACNICALVAAMVAVRLLVPCAILPPYVF